MNFSFRSVRFDSQGRVLIPLLQAKKISSQPFIIHIPFCSPFFRCLSDDKILYSTVVLISGQHTSISSLNSSSAARIPDLSITKMLSLSHTTLMHSVHSMFSPFALSLSLTHNTQHKHTQRFTQAILDLSLDYH